MEKSEMEFADCLTRRIACELMMELHKELLARTVDECVQHLAEKLHPKAKHLGRVLGGCSSCALRCPGADRCRWDGCRKPE